jgi:mannose-6-phosphate isomerase-like protein (cupin superfamily)
LGPVTETFGVIHPASWLEFFRYVTEKYDGILYPEFDDRNLKEILIPKVMSAPQGQYDVHFHPHHQGAEVSEWGPEDEKLPEGTEPYYLRANTGPRWLLGGVMSRPFITTKQSDGRFAISSIESSSRLAANPFSKKLSFPRTHHCFCVLEGAVEFDVDGFAPAKLTEGETVFIAKGAAFSLKFLSKYVRIWTFTSGDGVETLIHEAGKPFQGFVLPDSADEVDEQKVKSVCEKLGVVA